MYFRSAAITIKYPDLYNISAVCAKLRLEHPCEIVEATLKQSHYREAIEKEIAEWCDSGYQLQEPVRVIGLQVFQVTFPDISFQFCNLATYFAAQVVGCETWRP